MKWLFATILAILSGPLFAQDVGSKKFTESVILGEMARIAIVDAGVKTGHRRELGGSRILWDALRAGEISLYPEYTGTLRFEILSAARLKRDEDIAAVLAKQGLAMSRPLGFSNGYALAMRAQTVRKLGIRTIGDLADHPDLGIAVSNEFIARGDGWQALTRAYGLQKLDVRGIDHDLAYRALDNGQIDVTDAYTTDAEIDAYGLTLLEDDRDFFPRYDAVFVYRQDMPKAAVGALNALADTIEEAKMRRVNRMVRLEGESETRAAMFAMGRADQAEAVRDSLVQRILPYVRQHIALVAIALAAALIVAIPLGILAARTPRLGAIVIPATGLLQTIPSLALFVMLIPLLGIGAKPTIAALFLYSLLPIVRNVHAGLTGISPQLIDSARALGLSRMARLRRIELPLALPTIMAGIRTAAVIAVGLATLGALIGAGGLGQPILTGIRLNDTALILEGAIPAALLALAFEGLFHFIQNVVTPRGLRLGKN